ncbi:MAG TPA: acetamidase/formamidase family protein [Candidatus Xenobia bacterium]|nr:acetamidase/formamidase family protein [Candidatus Xenobia bacterium]
MKPKPATTLIAFLVLAAAAAAAETHKYRPKPEELKYNFATAPPVLRIKPGDTVETWTANALGPAVKKPGDQMAPDQRPNPNTGPFHIEGAEPGDTIAVHLISIEPAHDWAVGIAGPGFGGLTQTRYTPMLDQSIPERMWYYRIDKQARTVEFSALDSDFKVKLPLRPFLGCLGVAPADDESRSTIVPEFFGGNMDTPEVRAGTTVYLPVNVAGALLYLGDGHAAQGEGEIAGTAAEVAMNVTFKVDLFKGRRITAPRLEDDTHLMTAGSYRPLEDAMRIASRELIQWMVEDYGLSALDAYELLSVAMESNISQIVDPNYTVVAKIKKSYLPSKKK